jgi:hypothetical protein
VEGLDSATWQALGLVLTVAGLAMSALVWSRRGPASGLRAVAWSLLPLAAGLTGVLKLAWEIADSVVSWATRLVFSPVVWLGLVVAGVSLVLFVVSGMMRRRGAGGSRKPVASGKAASGKGASGKGASDKGATAGALPRRRSAPEAKPPQAGGGKASDDMDEIEEILRRHGIQ